MAYSIRMVYLAGLPAWVVVFFSEHNSIAAGVEYGRAPAMIVGLIIELRDHGEKPRWLDHIARITVLNGLGLSFYEFGWLNTARQFLEIGIAAGFLIGTYMMAKDKTQEFFWLVLGYISCAALMGTSGT